MALAFFASLLWAIAGAMFYTKTGWGIIPILLSGPTIMAYVAQVYPFWIVNAQPKHKAFVYQFTAIFFFTVGLILLLVKVQIVDFVAHQFPSYSRAIIEDGCVASMCGSFPFFVFAAYNIYVSQKILKVNKRRTFSRKQIDEEVEKVTTGRLADEKDLKKEGCLENDGFFLGAQNGKPVFIRDAVHLITYGGPGSGKSIGCVIPNILNWPGSLFVTDPKGELAAATADHRRKMGQEVIFLNPWRLFGVENTPFNPLNILLKDVKNSKSPKASHALKEREVADARVIAQILIPEPPQGDQNKWVRDGAREMLEAFMLYFAAHKPELCSLIGLQRAINYADEDYTIALTAMKYSPEFGGVLASYGNSLCNSYAGEPQQHQNYRSEAAQAVRPFVGWGAMRDSVSIRAKFDMEKLVKMPTTIYLAIPGEQRDAYQSWMKLIVTIAVETIGRYGNGQRPCLFMLDEFANLGRLANIQKGLAEYRGAGFRGWLIVQDRAQLEAVYPGPEARAVENLCDVTQILDCKFDHATELSERVGQKGVVRISESAGPQFDARYRESQRTTQIEQKPIMVANQIINLGSKQLIFTKKLPPMVIDKCPYWTVDPWRNQVTPNPLEKKTAPPTKESALVKIPAPKSGVHGVTT